MRSVPDGAGVICLGASAGGLRSLEAIVSRLPATLPWPVLIAQHLQADHISQMQEILQRIALMPVREAVDGELPQPGTIYTCASSHEMGLTTQGRFALREPAPGRATPHGVDHLFATASYARPGRTVAVVLSGTGSDGATGSLIVKLYGGTVIVESAVSAQHAGMPDATMRAGSVDAVLPADKIAPLVEELARGGLQGSATDTRAVVDRIAAAITKPGGTQFAHYRASTLRRRADKRRALIGLPTLAAYADRIESDTTEQAALIRSLLIPVTSFFRDPASWRAVEEEIIPLLAERARAGHSVRVWCAGCASGEEAYTMAILLAENIVDRSRVRILGTDLDPEAVRAAMAGSFDLARMDGVDQLRRDRFFRAEKHGFVANQDLRDLVEFREHDLTRDASPGRFDLIVCRNLLIYFDERLQARCLRMFREALAGPRILYLGRSERPPDALEGFAPVVRAMRLFRATGAVARMSGPAPETARVEPGRPQPAYVEQAHVEPAHGVSWSDPTDEDHIEEPDAVVLVLDKLWRVTHANDLARRVVDGEPVGADIFDLFPRWQGSPVQDALRACVATGRSVKVRAAPTPAGPMDVTLEAAPGGEGTLLLATPVVVRTPVTRDPMTRDHEVRQVKADLAATNDELQTANEELAATNEELQSTNEELASLNEEFQSTNQTLASTNVELGAVASTAREATALINELVQSWRDAIVACDDAQRVTVFNKRAGEMFGLDPSCIGRQVHLLPLAKSRADLEGWLTEAQTTRVERAVDHHGAPFRLSVEHVKTRVGHPLGWVLSWST